MSTYSNLSIELIGTGEQDGTWGATTNKNLQYALQNPIANSKDIAVTGANQTLAWSATDNTEQDARYLRLKLTGSSGGSSDLLVPELSEGKNYYVYNASDTDVTVKTSAAGIEVPAGKSMALYQTGVHSGTNYEVVEAVNYSASYTIASGVINGTTIGATTPSTGAFTTLSATSTFGGAGVDAKFASPPAIGSSAAGTGAFTTLSASSTFSGVGVDAKFASPPAIGSSVAGTGAFTTLSASSTVSGTGAFTTLSATSTVSGAGVTARFATPGPIGDTSPSTGAFTSLSTTLNLQVDGQGFSPTLTLTDAATITWDTNSGQVSKVTLAGNRTMAAPTNLQDGGFYSIQVIQDGTGSRTLAWNAIFKWNAATAPTLSTAAAAVDFFNFRSDGTNLYEQGQTLGVS